MALKVKSVGQYGLHAAAKRAGFQVDDVLVAINGNRELEREQDWFSYALENFRPGDSVEVELLRGDAPQTLTLPIQQ